MERSTKRLSPSLTRLWSLPVGSSRFPPNTGNQELGPPLPTGETPHVSCGRSNEIEQTRYGSECDRKVPFQRRRRAEFEMKISSERTWMPAAESGFRTPMTANQTPMPSTPTVPQKFVQMVRYAVRLIRIVSAIF